MHRKIFLSLNDLKFLNFSSSKIRNRFSSKKKRHKKMADTIINDLFALGFLIGLLIIYVPQFYKINKKRTSLGFSVWFMFLGHTASFISCLNALVFYINNLWTCHGIRNCTEEFLGFGLIGIQWFLYWIQYLLFVKFYPKKKSRKLLGEDDPPLTFCQKLQTPKATLIYSHVIGVIFLCLTMGLLGHHHWINPSTDDLKVWVGVMEGTISIMFLAHYIPQIWETYKLKQVGSMSLITLALMTPGTFLWAIFLATQSFWIPEAEGSSPLVWVPYLIVGAFQVGLLVMGIYYDRKNKEINQYRKLLFNISDDSDLNEFFNQEKEGPEETIRLEHKITFDGNLV